MRAHTMTNATNKPTKVFAGCYTLGDFGINKVEGIGWITCDIDDLHTGAGHDVFQTLAEAVDAINNSPAYQRHDKIEDNYIEADTMTYTQHAANEQALADAWLAENESELDAVIAVGDDTGRSVANPRPESDKVLHTIELSGQPVVTDRQMVTATESTFETSREPSSSLAGVDPESIGFYVATRKQSEMATRERKTFGISELVLSKDSKGAAGTPRIRRPRRSAKEKAAAIRARRK